MNEALQGLHDSLALIDEACLNLRVDDLRDASDRSRLQWTDVRIGGTYLGCWRTTTNLIFDY